MFTGGVVQVIDSLLIPPSNITETTAAFNLTSFEGALWSSNLMDKLSVTPDVTMFAPANEAFQALGPAISDMTIEELATVLDYHVLPQEVFSTSLVNGSVWMTQQGENITVRQSGNNVYINSAQLLTSDILVANGVLHVIDNVLNPAGPGATPNPTLATQIPVFASATEVGDLPFTSAIPCTSACPVTSSSQTGSVTSAGTKSTSTPAVKSSTSSISSSSSKALGAAVAKQTGFGAAGLMVALGGAVMMI
jgi:transforming growth factor-beta-induced protein